MSTVGQSLRDSWTDLDAPRRRWLVILAVAGIVLLGGGLLLGADAANLLLALGAAVLAGGLATLLAGRAPVVSQAASTPAPVEDPARLRTNLIWQLSSGDEVEATLALEMLRAHEWLSNGCMQGAFLSGVTLPGADLRRVDFQRAFLFGATLHGASFERASLQGANFYEAQLQTADLSGARLQAANLFRASLVLADLSAADLQGANLGGANLQQARLDGATLRGAILSGANLQDASLFEARLERADLRGARLRGADLTGARFDTGTILPDGVQWTPEADLAPFIEPESPHTATTVTGVREAQDEMPPEPIPDAPRERGRETVADEEDDADSPPENPAF
jgi:uncharacterized protein YjbI with pentapeptide repeats